MHKRSEPGLMQCQNRQQSIMPLCLMVCKPTDVCLRVLGVGSGVISSQVALKTHKLS